MSTQAGSPCPNCKRARDPKGICWRCRNRDCAVCGRPTGGAFFPHCIIHQDAAEEAVRTLALPDAPGEEPGPARVWTLVFRAESGPVPMSTRVKQVVKYSLRRHGLLLHAAPNHVPDDVRLEHAITYADVVEWERWVEAKAAAFDLLVSALVNQWHDGTWSANCTSLVDQPTHATPRECVPDLIAWAQRVAGAQAKKRVET